MDDPKQPDAPDDQRIDTTWEYGLRHWMNALDVSRERLDAAVRAVGNSVKDVREYLGKGS